MTLSPLYSGPSDGLRIGIDLGGSKIEGILLSSDGETLARDRVATPRGDYIATIGAVRMMTERLEEAVNGCATVGVGVPGTVSPATGLVKNANSVWLIGKPFDRDLSAALGRPVRVANDANCFALSEAVDGAGAGARSVFGVILGTGVGGGFVFDGQIVDGPNAIGGEWGHNPLPWPGPDELPGNECYCGMRGCLETYLAGPALEAQYGALTDEPLSATAIAERARAEGNAPDSMANAVLTNYTGRLARGLAGVINILDPEVIVLGGGLSSIARLYKDVPALLPKYVFSDTVETRLVPPVHGAASGVRGAAWLWPDGRLASANEVPA